jgi:hypothetical protein
MKMSLDDMLEAIKEEKKNRVALSSTEYWAAVNKIAEKEQKAFEEERKRLSLSYEALHRPFDI